MATATRLVCVRVRARSGFGYKKLTCGGELARDWVEGALALLGLLAARRARVDPCEVGVRG